MSTGRKTSTQTQTLTQNWSPSIVAGKCLVLGFDLIHRTNLESSKEFPILKASFYFDLFGWFSRLYVFHQTGRMTQPQPLGSRDGERWDLAESAFSGTCTGAVQVSNWGGWALCEPVSWYTRLLHTASQYKSSVLSFICSLFSTISLGEM